MNSPYCLSTTTKQQNKTCVGSLGHVLGNRSSMEELDDHSLTSTFAEYQET